MLPSEEETWKSLRKGKTYGDAFSKILHPFSVDFGSLNS